MHDILNVKISKGDSLVELENYNRSIHGETKPIRMFMPLNFEKKFFHSARVTSLIATACLTHKQTILTEWWDHANNDNINKRLSESLIGITSVCLAGRIENSKHQLLDIDVDNFIRSVAINNRGLVDNSGSGSDFIFCSFDSENNDRDYPRPISLSASNVQDFTTQFLKIKRDKIDQAFGINKLVGQTELFNEYNTYEREKSLAALIYEFNENTIQHGNRDENNNLIEGIRSFSIRRHIFNRPEEIKKQSEGFKELFSYFSQIAKNKKYKNLLFYEITIADSGIGIVKRFLASRPDFRNEEVFMKLTDFDKLNHIIKESLSSKMFSGAGKGIKIALKNLMSLDGFVTLRTNDIWAYFDGTSRIAKINPVFTQVHTAQRLENMRGTSYSILIPVSSK